MSLAIHCATGEIGIPFQSEWILFSSWNSFTVEYTVLVENRSDHEICELILFYPRSLVAVDAKGFPTLSGVEDASAEVIERASREQSSEEIPSISWSDDIYNLRYPAPNQLEKDLVLNGRLSDSDLRFGLPSGVTNRHVELLNQVGVSTWCINLKMPLRTNERQWIALRVGEESTGTVLEGGFLGPQVFHTFQSASLTYGAIQEICCIGESDLTPELNVQFQELRKALALNDLWKQQIELHEISLAAGNPSKMMVTSVDYRGPLRMRNGSPFVSERTEVVPGGDIASFSSVAYQWQTGSRVEPLEYPPGMTQRGEHWFVRLALLGR